MPLVGQPTPNASVPEADAKALKAESNKRHNEKVKAARQATHLWALSLRDELKTAGALDRLKPETKNHLLNLCIPPEQRQSATAPSFFTLVFGLDAAVGKTVTLQDIINNTQEGLKTIKEYCKKWAKKGIEIEMDIKAPTSTDKQAVLKSTFKIVKMGTPA